MLSEAGVERSGTPAESKPTDPHGNYLRVAMLRRRTGSLCDRVLRSA